MKVNIYHDNIENTPRGVLNAPSHQGDAGYDIVAAGHPKISGEIYQGYLFKNINYIEYETNIRLEIEKDMYGEYEFFSLMYPRSSISKYNLSLCNSVGIIDSGYSDTIKVRFNYIPQPENYSILDGKHMLLSVDYSKIYQKGDKISQLVFSRHFHPKVISKDFQKKSNSKRNKGGFGSTGQ